MNFNSTPRHSAAGLSAWIISDGKAGHEAQCLGVAQALGLNTQVKRIAASGVYKWAAPWGPVAPAERFGASGSAFAPPWPTFAFATGRTTIPYIRALRRRAGLATYTVILMDPRTGPASADLVWVPEHDNRRGTNVFRTLTSPHGYSPERLRTLRSNIPANIAALPHPRVAVLIGGPNRDYKYSNYDQARLLTAIGALAKSGAGLMITPSRRTPEKLLSAIQAVVNGPATLLWTGEGANPYPDFIAHADSFVVTADSVNMACEAAATGRPIHIFTPAGGGRKFDRFHQSLQAYGATRPLPETGEQLAVWNYEPLDSAGAIGEEILRRWSIRSAMLPGLVNRTTP